MNIGELTTLARPYAVAAFEFALEHNDVPSWETLLMAAAQVANDKNTAPLLNNPNVTAEEQAQFFADVLQRLLDSHKKNYLFMLAEKNRLSILPQIAVLFKSYREAHDQMLTVKVTSAVALDEPYKNKLIKALSKRLSRQVSLKCEVNPELLGGIIVNAGDTVIDGSIRGKLNRLLESL